MSWLDAVDTPPKELAGDATLNHVCFQCKKRHPGGDKTGGHCKTCHMSFRSNAGFDAHRVGPHGDDRTCLTPDQMTESGWSRGEWDVWRLPGPAVSPWSK